MSARIPEMNADMAEDSRSQKYLSYVEENAHKYENGFLESLLKYIKDDDVLKSFYVRLVYECEVVQKVIDNRSKYDLVDLKDIIDNMTAATGIETIAFCDSQFHRRLFSIAREDEFYEWYQMNSKELLGFLKGFWTYIGYHTPYYYELMEIHTNIYNAIEECDKELAVETMQKHFSILLLQLLGATFQKGNM
jgi:DNA-binding GntR family transcriptional regulator